MYKKLVVIGWQPLSRRNQTFTCRIHAPLYLIHYLWFKCPPIAPFKYILQSIKTLMVLWKERPDFIMVENPPIVLSFVAYFYSKIFGAQLIIDSGTGAFTDPKWKWSIPIFRFLARKALLNIVTNEVLYDILNEWGARAFVLEDCVPDLPETQPIKLKEGFNVVAINSFSFDEPIEEILAAAANIPEINFHITGNTKYAKKNILEKTPPNVIFTDYLKEPYPYFSVLRAADAIMVLSTSDCTPCCGMFEAVSLGKPLIASDGAVIRRIFNKGTVYVDISPEDIARGAVQVLNNNDQLRKEMVLLRKECLEEWCGKWSSLEKEL